MTHSFVGALKAEEQERALLTHARPSCLAQQFCARFNARAPSESKVTT
jgi:hypothetical protein